MVFNILNSLILAQSISPPEDPSPWPLKRSELSGYWQMHGYYIHNKYFVNNLATLFHYQKSFTNNNFVNKIKCIYWFNSKIVIDSQRKQVILNFNLTQIKSWCINYNQYIQNKINNKLRMNAIDYTCFKLEGKATRSVKKKKNNFINVIGDKFAMSNIDKWWWY